LKSINSASASDAEEGAVNPTLSIVLRSRVDAKRQLLRLTGGGEIGERLGHSIEAEGVKLVEGWMFEQVVFS
jgi:hypothetical protein